MRKPICLAVVLAGCGGNAAPELAAIADQHAHANEALVVALRATDADGDRLRFDFASDLPDLANRARIVERDDGRALFRFSPLYSDVGDHVIRFRVSDGVDDDERDVLFRIGAAEGTTAPFFVQPLGSGTTVDLETTDCAAFPIVVEDPDSLEVVLGQKTPLAGSTLVQRDGHSGAFQFCPTKDQVAAADRYGIVLSADDHEQEVLKDYLLVLRTGDGAGCPGAPPLVEHAAQDAHTVDDVTITAEVSDDLGIKYEPLLYYALTPPGDPPDLGAMTQLTMEAVSGGATAGTWAADVPNPVANQPPGSSAQLYYVIVAQDNDDASGSCDHLTQLPASGSFAVTVTNPGGAGGKAPCQSCSADVQCGDADDRCVLVGGAYHCGLACVSSSQCPADFYCSYSQLTSIDGASARQCLPEDNQCGPSGGECIDDTFEDNDTRSQSKAIGPGTHGGLKSCPAPMGDDEDWYVFTLGASAQVSASISGSNASDLDLALTDAAGVIVDLGNSLSSTESVTACLPAGSYHLHVFAYGTGDNPYSLMLNKTPSTCTSVCIDDGNENDDDALQARLVDLNFGPHTATDQQICSGDDDWYEVYMYAGETLHASLAFLQTSPSEDLDLYVYDATLTNLTGCDEQTPSSCDPFNGQSGTSNETLAWPITQTGNHYLVVHGWNGSENGYDVCLGLSAVDCP